MLPLIRFEDQTTQLRHGCSRIFRMAPFKEHLIHNGLAQDRLEEIAPCKVAGGLSHWRPLYGPDLHPICRHEQ
jgi:hypothetical protein